MLYLTGGSGFIGTNFIRFLNDKNYDKIIIVDELGTKGKWKNLQGTFFKDIISPEVFKNNLPFLLKEGDTVVHLGATTSTTETDADLLWKNNVQYSQTLIDFCVTKGIKIIYASSAAVYGLGENGFNDQEGIDYQHKLKPLNPYGWSKLKIDEFVLQNGFDKKVVGLRLFNVWGNYEDHKENQASIISKSATKLFNGEKIELFKHKDKDLGRDFIFVDDVCQVIAQFISKDKFGIYNVGTGESISWLRMVVALANEFQIQPSMKHIPIPEKLLPQYQFQTKANITKLQSAIQFTPSSLKDSIATYVRRFHDR